MGKSVACELVEPATSEIWGFHSAGKEDYSLLEYEAVSLVNQEERVTLF
jgi:hypothetical protein